MDPGVVRVRGGSRGAPPSPAAAARAGVDGAETRGGRATRGGGGEGGGGTRERRASTGKRKTLVRAVRTRDRADLERALLGLMRDGVVTADELERRVAGEEASAS